MDAIVGNASGSIDGEAVSCGIIMMATPSDQILLCVGIMQQATVSDHVGTVNSILQGIQPVDPDEYEEYEDDDEYYDDDDY